jgi:hypothetical protein
MAAGIADIAASSSALSQAGAAAEAWKARSRLFPDIATAYSVGYWRHKLNNDSQLR